MLSNFALALTIWGIVFVPVMFATFSPLHRDDAYGARAEA